MGSPRVIYLNTHAHSGIFHGSKGVEAIQESTNRQMSGLKNVYQNALDQAAVTKCYRPGFLLKVNSDLNVLGSDSRSRCQCGQVLM